MSRETRFPVADMSEIDGRTDSGKHQIVEVDGGDILSCNFGEKNGNLPLSEKLCA